MEVKNPSELFAFLVTANESKRLRRDISYVRKIRPRFLWGIEFGIDLRDFEEGRNHIENVRVAERGIVESRSVDQNDTTTIQIESVRRLNGVRARSQSFADSEVGSA